MNNYFTLRKAKPLACKAAYRKSTGADPGSCLLFAAHQLGYLRCRADLQRFDRLLQCRQIKMAMSCLSVISDCRNICAGS